MKINEKIGLYDVKGKSISNFVELFGHEKLVIFKLSDQCNFKNIDEKLLEYLTEKDLFFDKSKHIVLFVESVNDISFFTRSILMLINGKIFTLTVITHLDLKSFLQLENAEVKNKLNTLTKDNIFSIQNEFSLIDFKKRIGINR